MKPGAFVAEVYRQSWMRLALGLLLLLALAEFSVRGPVRAFRQSTFNDFISPYIQTKAWLRGLDPYESQVVARLWPPEASPPPSLFPERGIPSPYPLTAFPLLVPFALVRWPVALLLWTAVNTIAFVTAVYCAITLARIQLRSTDAALIVLFALALAPFHTAIAAANIVLIVFALGMLAAVRLEHHGCVCAGVLLAAAAALKPTVALCFFIYCAAKGRWRAVVIAVAGVAVLFCIADVRMILGGVHWIGSYLLNTRRMFGSGAINDYTPANRARFDLLNLQLVFFQVARSKVWAEILSWLVVGGLFGRWILSGREQEIHRDSLLDLAILATIGLLPFYHRFTDGCLLLPAIAWSVAELGRTRRAIARVIPVLAVPFLLPGAALVRLLAGSNSRAGELAQSWWWQFLLAPHQVWMILAISVLLLAARGISMASPAPGSARFEAAAQSTEKAKKSFQVLDRCE